MDTVNDCSQKEQQNSSSELRLLDNGNEPQIVLQHVKQTVEDLALCNIAEVEKVVKNAIPMIAQMLSQIYSTNSVIIQSKEHETLGVVKSNFQVLLDLMDASNFILEHVLQKGTVLFQQIPSLPVNMAHIIYLTFEHYKNSQKTYSTFYKSITEVLDLFRKTQETHSRFLSFIDVNLTFDLSSESDILACKELVNIILQISQTLSGINMKSLVDNWKGFIKLIEKYNFHSAAIFNLRQSIEVLTLEVDTNLQAAVKQTDSSKRSQHFKVSAFFVKVVLKLFEISLNILEYDEVFRFWLMIHRWQTSLFLTNQFSNELEDLYNALMLLCTESMMDVLVKDGVFIKKFFTLDEGYLLSLNQPYGCLTFAIALIRELPKVLKNQQILLNDIKVAPSIRLILNLTKNCYEEYFFDENSTFYEDLITCVSIMVLLFPSEYSQIEKLLLENVMEENIWTSLVAIDIWCCVLKHASEIICRSTLAVLLTNIKELKLGKFHQTPSMVLLKILTQRVFKLLPISVRIDELTKYEPKSHLLIWKVLHMKNIPLSHRYYIEFIISDLEDKMCAIAKEDCSVNDILFLMEHLDIVSYTDFNEFEMTTSRLIPIVMNLWSYDFHEISANNMFFSYFVSILAKNTIVVAQELTAEDLQLVLNQLKLLISEEPVCQLISCEVLKAISGKTYNNPIHKSTLLSSISDVLQILFNQSLIINQAALEAFCELSENNFYGSVVHKVSVSSSTIKKMVTDYTRRTASDSLYSIQYFKKLRNHTFKHRCLQWTNAYQPKSKKIKIETDADFLIENLKNHAEKLKNAVTAEKLNSRQIDEVKHIITKLQDVI